MYNENDYKVLSTYKGGSFKEDILNGAELYIEGAIFRIERIYTNNMKPTPIFKFDSLSEFVEGDCNNELIEIGWNTCSSGLMKIAKELNLKYCHNGSYFSTNRMNFYFEDKNM